MPRRRGARRDGVERVGVRRAAGWSADQGSGAVHGGRGRPQRLRAVERVAVEHHQVGPGAGADPAEMEEILRPTGFYRAKTRAVIKLSQDIVERFDGEVPGRLDDLVTLPGVGRKTANVVLGNAFGVPGITVDTHFGRLARRFGWTTSEDPVKVEAEVGALFPKKDWTMLSHVVIFHGRRICHARRPACGVCPVAQWCPSFGEGEIDADAARKLLKYELAVPKGGEALVGLLVDGAEPDASFSTGHRGTPTVPRHSGLA